MKKLGIIIIIVGVLLIVTGVHDAIMLAQDTYIHLDRYTLKEETACYGWPEIWSHRGYPIRLILLGLVGIIGGMMLFRKEKPKICPYCAEKIKLKARICRFCSKELPT